MNRDFKGIWIPRELYLNTNLLPTEKLLLAEIDSLSTDERGCYASNKHLADFMQMTVGSVANMISKLRKLGFIVDYKYDNLTGEREMRAIFKVVKTPETSKSDSYTDEGGVHTQMKGGSYTDEGGVHTQMNDTYIEKKEEEKRKIPPNGNFFSKADIEDFEEQLEAKQSEAKAPPISAAPPPPNFDADISEVLTELNKLSGRSLAVEGERAKSSRAAVAKLLKKKYSKDEIISVVQTKCFEWVNEPRMAQYLHPSTLFSSKFQTYLDQYNDLLKNPHLAEQFKKKVNDAKSKNRTAFEVAQQIAVGVARLRAEGY